MNRLVTASIVLVLATTLATMPCSASILSGSVSFTNSHTGNVVKGTYDFSVSGTDLIVTIANTSDPLTTNGDVLTGVLFVPSIFPMSLDKVEVPSGDTIWTDKSTSNAVGAVWTAFWSSTFDGSPPAAGTVGAATTGFGGLFSMSGVSGGKPGSANYGAVSSGTFPQSGHGPGNPNKFDLADDTLVLTFSAGGSSLGGMSVGNVELLFGTAGNTVIPEPSAIVIWSLLTGLTWAGGAWRMFYRRRRQQRENLTA